MFVLSLIWIALGLLVAVVARAARPWPRAMPLPRWRALLTEGALAGLLGGWLGALVFGRFYGAPNALWLSAVLLVVGPWLLPRVRAWWHARRANTPVSETEAAASARPVE
jgi:hypothetical protein